MLFGHQVNLDKVSIAAPCPIKWDEMEGNSRVRFCNLCELNVYNISEMSRREAETFLRAQSGPLCLRLYRRKDGTLITKDCPIGRKMLNGAQRRLRAIAAAIAAIVNTTAVFGQQQRNKKLDAEAVGVDGPKDTYVFETTNIIDGRYYREGPVQRAKKIIPSTPSKMRPTESSNTSPNQQTMNQSNQLEAGNKPDTTALDAFHAAQTFEAAKEPDKAIKSYETALETFRYSQLNYDKKFAAIVAEKYSKLLRKQHNPKKAALIEKEFCERK